jgi:HAMP domain-containing protein
MRPVGALVDLIARAPARVQVKLLAAFLAIVILLISAGAIGLQVLSRANHRTGELIRLQRQIDASRQVQHETTSQLYSVSSALLSSDELTLSNTLRQLSLFGYSVDRLQFVAKDQVQLLDRFRQDYDQFTKIVTDVVELIRAGQVAEAREMQSSQIAPLADQLERMTNLFVNLAEADMVSGIEASDHAYANSQWIVVAFALGIILALTLGYSISLSLMGPVTEVEARLKQIAAGDFSQRVRVINRDELGTLAANVNKTSEQLGFLYQQLELANLAKSRFLAAASHDLTAVACIEFVSRPPSARTKSRRTQPATRTHPYRRRVDERVVQRASGHFQARCRCSHSKHFRFSARSLTQADRDDIHGRGARKGSAIAHRVKPCKGPQRLHSAGAHPSQSGFQCSALH